MSATPLVIRDFSARYGRGIVQTVHDHRLIIVAVIGFYAIGVAARYYFLGPSTGMPPVFATPFAQLTIIILAGFFILHAVHAMIWIRPARLTGYIIKDLRDNYLTPERIAQGVLILLLIHPFVTTFSFFKTLIPVIQPFYLDKAFMTLDRVLHGGQDPWIWLQYLLGTPALTLITNFFYNLWFFVVFGVVFWQAFYRKDLVLRQQFLLTFFSLWVVLGLVSAVVLSSAGPVYYGRVTGLADPYVPLMNYLNTTNETYPLWSLKTQELLWQGYERGINFTGSGISAMPSMHVATTTLFAILGWRVNFSLGIILTVFAGIILLGSVHLAWHYAVDGYLAIVMTAALWWGIGKILNSRRTL